MTGGYGRIGIQHRGRHRHDLGLELGGAGVHVALQHVGVRELPVHLGQELVVLVIA